MDPIYFSFNGRELVMSVVFTVNTVNGVSFSKSKLVSQQQSRKLCSGALDF